MSVRVRWCCPYRRPEHGVFSTCGSCSHLISLYKQPTEIALFLHGSTGAQTDILFPHCRKGRYPHWHLVSRCPYLCVCACINEPVCASLLLPSPVMPPLLAFPQWDCVPDLALDFKENTLPTECSPSLACWKNLHGSLYLQI